MFSYSCFWALEPPGLILSCCTISVLCYNFWECPPTFIFPAFSSTIMFSLYRSSFVPLNVLFFFLITSCYFRFKILSFWEEIACLLPPFFPFFLEFSFPSVVPVSSKLPFSVCFGPSRIREILLCSVFGHGLFAYILKWALNSWLEALWLSTGLIGCEVHCRVTGWPIFVFFFLSNLQC